MSLAQPLGAGKWKGYNFPMHRSLAGLLFLTLLAACANDAGTITSLPPAVPYLTPTQVGIPTVIPPSTEIYLPTPTTFTYTITQGDTLSEIAGRFGVTLEALIAANPSVQPSALQAGTTIVIPTGSTQTGEPTPTPAAVPIRQARCWPETGGGSWCFALIENQYSESLENLSAQFNLLDAGGQVIASQTAYGMLDILPAGRSMPLAVHFAPPVRTDLSLQVQPLSAIRLLPGDTRYLPVMVENTLVSVTASGTSAEVSGLVLLTGTGTASTLWVLAVAYDTAGEVVGIRRWESSTSLATGTPVTFDFLVSSLGPPIDRVEFLAEARP